MLKNEEKERIHAGLVPKLEKKIWLKAAKDDGFDRLWPWIAWIVRKYLKEKPNG